MRYFIANWKAEKQLSDCLDWIDQFTQLAANYHNPDIQIVICPPVLYLSQLKQHLNLSRPGIKLGAQDVSQFERGKYTGEITAPMLCKLIDFVIIGHSERRRYLGENDNLVLKKTRLAHQYGIKSIVCVSKVEHTIPPEADFIAYEPPSAIATGNNYSRQDVLDFRSKINLRSPMCYLYGGSVNRYNVNQYLSSTDIDGFLIGTAALKPKDFFGLINLS